MQIQNDKIQKLAKNMVSHTKYMKEATNKAVMALREARIQMEKERMVELALKHEMNN